MPTFAELFELSATDVVLVVLFVYVVYKLFFARRHIPPPPDVPQVEPLEKQDMTVEQLRRYDGVQDEHICMAICGKIYDVTKGRDYYGPEGAYGALAGHDATRALGTMDVKQIKDEFDDHAGMDPSDLEEAKEWQQRLSLKYPFVGRLLAPGEQHTEYETVAENREGN
ncbi:hypothetical protein niasHS_006713 [Heterodera schachtii]|uniref:Cytochrome b5 heme-binding domain-containing protein n=1 Tax=Heterodera schachtii TaxID=97005 RepID=A0ABD2JI12_HETSC